MGSVGAVGAEGATGTVGAAGVVGAAGAEGAVGAEGAAGTARTVGAAGAVGALGADGVLGATGAAGAAGTEGAAGAVRAVGAVGIAGAVGSIGAAGALGAEGANGALGPTGEVLTGVKGDPVDTDRSIVKLTTKGRVHLPRPFRFEQALALTIWLPNERFLQGKKSFFSLAHRAYGNLFSKRCTVVRMPWLSNVHSKNTDRVRLPATTALTLYEGSAEGMAI